MRAIAFAASESAVEKIRGVKMMRRGLSIDGDTSAVEAIGTAAAGISNPAPVDKVGD
jgi:hypothetical protein